VQFPERIDSKFRFVLLTATRAEQMMQGAKSKMDHPVGKPCQVAIKEIQQDLVEWDYGPEVPERAAEVSAPAEEVKA
jgi:DNA-directed RNA polymerase omega subunit